MNLGPFESCAADLAPGDRGVLDTSWDSFTVESIVSPAAASLDEAWGRLWREFSPRGEMERREVIEDRLRWDPREPVGGHAFLYEMLVVRRHGEMVAVRDHTAILGPAFLAGEEGAAVVVHLSHVLVEPALRGKGLASWLRAMPVQTARRSVARARGGPPQGRSTAAVPITLVAEMEHDDGVTPAVIARLRSYAKAGFRVVDPGRLDYAQPDFRDAAEIDRTGVRHVPLSLVLRRVGREQEESLGGHELRGIVAALQAMFAVHVRADHMESLRSLAAKMPPAGDEVALLPPGRGPTTRGVPR